MNKTAVYRKEHFNSAHRLHNPLLSEAENIALYGKCNNPYYHGNNYELVVKVTGMVDEISGYVIDTKMLSNLIREYVIEIFDHKNLNLDTEAFKMLNPTTENIARVIYDILREKINQQFELKIFLYETERNYVEYPA